MYTRSAQAGANIVTVTDDARYTVSAKVLQDVRGTGLTLTPATSCTMLTNETFKVFSVAGGTPPYRWGIANAALGTIAPSDSICVYTRTLLAGANIISVSDEIGQSTSTAIIQN